MTRYINPSEILPEILDPHPPVKETHPKIERENWESQMAKLVGLEDEIILEDQFREESPSPEISELQETPKKESLSSNPFTKLGLVGAGTLVIFLIVGAFLMQIMQLGNSKNKNNNITAVQPKPQEKIPSRLEKLEIEVESLKTKLAFADQEQAIKSAQETLRTKKTTSVNSPYSVVIPLRNSGSPEIQTVHVPKVVTVERIVRVPQPSSQRPIQAQIPKSISTPTPVSQPVNSIIAKSTPTSTPITEPVTPVATPIQQPPAETQTIAISQPTPQPVNTPNNTQTDAENQKPIPVGASAKGILATAVFGETSGPRDSNEEENVFVVTLQKPLKNRDGEVVIPAKAQLLTEISSLTDRGLLYLTVTKALWEEKGKVVEKTFPKGVLGVRSPEGKPLFAERYPNESRSISAMDMGVFFLGGLGKVAQLFNRTDSEVVTTTIGGTIVTNNNNAPNYAAGALEGGLNVIVPQITQRNQQIITEKLQRTNIWFIPAGTKVEVYVNQPINM